MLSSVCRWPRFSMLMLVGCSVCRLPQPMNTIIIFASSACRHQNIDCVRNDGKRHQKSYNECLSAWTACNHSCVR